MNKFSFNKEVHLEVLWELCSTSIARVHRNEVADGGVHRDVLVHELKTLILLPNCILDALDLRRVHNELNFMGKISLNLHSNDREDFHCDPIELIEAPPGTSLSQAHEDVPARLVVHLLAAVEHVDHDSNRPSEILRRLCLPSSSRTLGCSSHDQMQGLREGDVAPGDCVRVM